MKESELAAIVKGMSAAVKEHVEIEIEKATAPLKQRIAELEARPAGLQYCGVYTVGKAYAVHDGVTLNGSLWVALRDTTAAPGTADSGWQLAVKSGKDGRDGKDLR